MSRKFWLPIIASLLSGLTAFAQQDSVQTGLLEDVVLTATKIPKKTGETGKVVTIITAAQLQRSAGKDLAQLLNEQANIIVNGAGSNPGMEKSIYLRGATAGHTLILLDGIPVTDPSGSAGNFDLRLINLESVERIEILKGSQSTLYGSDAIAGVINIITKKPVTGKIKGVAGLAYGSYDNFRGNLNLSGRLNRLDYILSNTYYNNKGISESVDKNNTGTFDKDGFKQDVLFAKLGYKPKESWQFGAYLRHSNFKGNIDYDAFTDDRDYHFQSGNLQTGFQNKIRLKDATLNINYSYNEIDRAYINDSGHVAATAFDVYSKGKYKGREHYLEGIYAGKVGRKIQFTSGIEFRSSNTTQQYISISSFGDYITSIGRDSAKQRQYSAYASVYTALGKFRFETGARFNHHSAYGNNWTYNVNPFFFLAKQVKVFFNFSSAFKTPTLYQLYAPQYGNTSLNPESSIHSEAGIQYSNLDKKINTRLVIFRRDVSDAIVFAGKFINQDKQKDHGVEWESGIKPVEKLELKLFYCYVNGKVVSKINGRDTSYFNLFRRPRNSWGASINYQPKEQWFFTVNANSYGSRNDLDFSKYPAEQVTLPHYMLVNLYAEYTLRSKLKIFADIKNLTNTEYSEIFGYSTQRRNFQTGITIQF